MRVVAADRGDPPLWADVDVELDVVDRNNKPPLWDLPIYGPIFIKENVTVGTVVTAVKARSVSGHLPPPPPPPPPPPLHHPPPLHVPHITFILPDPSKWAYPLLRLPVTSPAHPTTQSTMRCRMFDMLVRARVCVSVCVCV